MRKSEIVRGWAYISEKIKLTSEHRVDQFKGLVDLLSDLCSSQDNFATDEDQEDNLGLHHAVDKTREEFRLVGAEIVMAARKSLKTDWELDIAGPDNVLDLEIRELGIEAELLDDTSVLPRRQLGVIFRLCACDDHLA